MFGAEVYLFDVELCPIDVELCQINVAEDGNDVEIKDFDVAMPPNGVEMYPRGVEESDSSGEHRPSDVEMGSIDIPIQSSYVENLAKSSMPLAATSTSSRHISTPIRDSVEMHSYIASPKSFYVAYSGSSSTLNRADVEE